MASHLNTANSRCHYVIVRHFRFQKCLPVYSNRNILDSVKKAKSGLFKQSLFCYTIIVIDIGVWRSLVARSAGGREVAGSNPVTPIFLFFIHHISCRFFDLQHTNHIIQKLKEQYIFLYLTEYHLYHPFVIRFSIFLYV